MFFSIAVPSVWDRSAESWALWCFDRPVGDEPDSDLYVEELVEIYDSEAFDNFRHRSELTLLRMSELHERYGEWTSRYSAAQLSQGLWAMFSYPCDMKELFFVEELTFAIRERAMRSLVEQYRVYVQGWNAHQTMPHGWNMLWDLLLAYREVPATMAGVALSCLQEILELKDDRCQEAALHGLNHLDHPDRPGVVQQWIEAHRDEDWNWQWVEACRDGQAM